MKKKLRALVKSFLEMIFYTLYLLWDALTPHPHSIFSSLLVIAVYSSGGIIVLLPVVILPFIQPISPARFVAALFLAIGFASFSFYVAIKAYKRFRELSSTTPQNF